MTRPNGTLKFALPRTESYTTHCFNVATYNGTTWVDRTAISQTSTADTPNVLIGAVDNEWHFCAEPGVNFNSVLLVVAVGLGTPVTVAEYYNGTAWVAVPGFTVLIGSSTFVGATAATFYAEWNTALMTDWADFTVNSVVCRGIRIRVTTAFSTAPTLTMAGIGRVLTLSATVPVSITQGRTFTNVWGEITWMGNHAAGIVGHLSHAVTINGVRTALTPVRNSAASSGEWYGHRRRFDMTAAFVAGYTGTTQTVTYEVGICCGADVAVNNQLQAIEVELFVNHDFDEATSTAAQSTHEIPTISPNAALTNTHLLVDTLEALTLPTGYTAQHAYFVLDVQTYSKNVAGSFGIAFQLNADAEQVSPIFVANAISGGRLNSSSLSRHLIQQSPTKYDCA